MRHIGWLLPNISHSKPSISPSSSLLCTYNQRIRIVYVTCKRAQSSMLKMENVRILKRGTPTESHLFAEKPIGVGAPDCRKSTDSSAEFYAGGGYATSPDPSCLPRPAFLLKEKGAATSFSFFSPGMFERFVLAHQVRG